MLYSCPLFWFSLIIVPALTLMVDFVYHGYVFLTILLKIMLNLVKFQLALFSNFGEGEKENDAGPNYTVSRGRYDTDPMFSLT